MSTSMRITSIGYWGAYPGPDAATSSFLIEGGDMRILIDCGSGVLQNLQAYTPPDRLDAVIITHYHADHTADIGCLQYAIRVSQSLGNRSPEPLPIYGHNENDGHKAMTYENCTEFRPFTGGRSLELGPFVFDFFRANHTVPSYSLRVRFEDFSAFFSGDTGYYDMLKDAAAGCNIFYCESSLYNAFAGAVEGHLTAGEAGRLAREAGVKELILTHLPHYGDHRTLVDEASQEYKGPVVLNRPGLLREFPSTGNRG